MRLRLAEMAGRRQNRRYSGCSLLAAAHAAVDAFDAEFDATLALRRKTVQRLARVTRRDNVQFDGLARVSHVTDATDWRVEDPFVVINPHTQREVAAAVAACIGLGRTT